MSAPPVNKLEKLRWEDDMGVKASGHFIGHLHYLASQAGEGAGCLPAPIGDGNLARPERIDLGECSLGSRIGIIQATS
ncbi:hypothetical protein C8R32_10427 [Nitrosospira sp. Nsp5]|uniref:Uncharacterized protein n=1 Tax=Nitrosospira multiformis TaxID=1231 RepID=A0ABY0TDN9_9PROT|nr:hypothetical protein C8R32_10427 [Nitrosospira sp. Nsp5]SDQ67587.1 hypothetical protein SAMN05216402_1806 [Nitrosospira multiformis]